MDAVWSLKQRVESYGGVFLHFSMCALSGRNIVPLNWELSPLAQSDIGSTMLYNCKHKEEMKHYEAIGFLSDCLNQPRGNLRTCLTEKFN